MAVKKDLFLIVLHIFGQSVKGPLEIKEFLLVSINHIAIACHIELSEMK